MMRNAVTSQVYARLMTNATATLNGVILQARWFTSYLRDVSTAPVIYTGMTNLTTKVGGCMGAAVESPICVLFILTASVMASLHCML